MNKKVLTFCVKHTFAKQNPNGIIVAKTRDLKMLCTLLCSLCYQLQECSAKTNSKHLR